MKRIFILITFSFTLLIGESQFSHAQCAMCKANAESSLKEGNTNARNLNLGIMYLLVMPYLLVGGIGYYWYINNKKKEQKSEASQA